MKTVLHTITTFTRRRFIEAAATLWAFRVARVRDWPTQRVITNTPLTDIDSVALTDIDGEPLTDVNE